MCVCEREIHLKVRLLEDPGQFSRTVVFNLQTADVAQDLRHQLHVVVLHRLQLHLLQLFVSLGAEQRRSGEGGCILLSHDSACYVSICLDPWMKDFYCAAAVADSMLGR